MVQPLCSHCDTMLYEHHGGRCPECGKTHSAGTRFENSDDALRKKVALLLDERKNAGLEGLVGELQCVIINTEPDNLERAVQDLLRYTGFEFVEAFEDQEHVSYMLTTAGSADFLLRSRKRGDNPFRELNRHPKSEHLPNTRLETLVFSTPDIERYVYLQKSRGISFLTDHIIHAERYSFIQTAPSRFTGNSIGFVEWHREPRTFFTGAAQILPGRVAKPSSAYQKNIKELDHVATRVKAEDRDAAILEFMELTNYTFDFAIYVESLNSITNVARLPGAVFALVFTSGIASYSGEESSGPTEKFIYNYGARAHHMAFRTEHIDDTFDSLKKDGMEFLIELVGASEEGLKQTFSKPSPHTLLVNEYIYRYGDFDGFFTKSNVTELTAVTGNQ
jgi:4-hydroxyphenylpyruvate dioxygenase-like putative hemolysin